jgi:hypothetical protein
MRRSSMLMTAVAFHLAAADSGSNSCMGGAAGGGSWGMVGEGLREVNVHACVAHLCSVHASHAAVMPLSPSCTWDSAGPTDHHHPPINPQSNPRPSINLLKCASSPLHWLTLVMCSHSTCTAPQMCAFQFISAHLSSVQASPCCGDAPVSLMHLGLSGPN